MPFCDASIGLARFGLAIDILSVAFWFQHYQVKRVIGCDSVSRINGRTAAHVRLGSSLLFLIDWWYEKVPKTSTIGVCGHCDVFGWWWSDEVDHYQFIDRFDRSTVQSTQSIDLSIRVLLLDRRLQ
jgi:hypothetical protein